MTYIIKDGEPTVWMLGDRYMNRLQDGFGGISNCSVFPSIHADKYMRDIHEPMVKLLKKYGPENGTFFVQGFADGEDLVFFDPALRFCGTLDCIPYENIFGINPVHWMINHSLTGVTDDRGEIGQMDWSLKDKTVVQLSLIAEPGKIGRIEGLERVKELPQVIDVVQLLHEGDVIDKPGTLQQVAVRAFIVCDSFSKCLECIGRIYSLVKISDEHGRELLMPFKPYGLEKAVGRVEKNI